MLNALAKNPGQAKRDAPEKLAHSYLDQARANRLSRRIGQRHESLRLLQDAVLLARDLRLPGGFYDALRNEAIAAIGLADLRQAQQSEWQREGGGAYPDSQFTRFLDYDVAGRVVLRQFADGAEICHLPGEGYDHAMAISPDGKFLAVGTSQGVRLVDAETGRDLARLEGPFEDRPEYCQFSPDGTRLVIVSRVGRRVHAWDLQLIGRQLHEMGLDGDLSPFPDPPAEPPPPVRLQIHPGALAME